MAEQEPELRELAVKIIEDADAAAVTTGIVVQELEYTYGIEVDHRETLNMLDEMVEEGVLEYHLGEYAEYAVPEE